MPWEQIGEIAVGLVLLAFTWVCWSGRWRGWADAAVAPASIPITVMPGLGLFVLCYGIFGLLSSGPGNVLLGVGFVALVAGGVLGFWDPDWFGPRWYRQRRSSGIVWPDTHHARKHGETSMERKTLDSSDPEGLVVADEALIKQAKKIRANLTADQKRMRHVLDVDRRDSPPADAPSDDALRVWEVSAVGPNWTPPPDENELPPVSGRLALYREALFFEADGAVDLVGGQALRALIPAASIADAGSVSEIVDPGEEAPTGVGPSDPVGLAVKTQGGAWLFTGPNGEEIAGEIRRRYVEGKQ